MAKYSKSIEKSLRRAGYAVRAGFFFRHGISYFRVEASNEERTHIAHAENLTVAYLEVEKSIREVFPKA